MPVTYEASQLLKVTVTMSYLRYNLSEVQSGTGEIKSNFLPGFGESPFNQASFNEILGPQGPQVPIVPIRDLGAASDLSPAAGNFTNTGTSSILPLGRV